MSQRQPTYLSRSRVEPALIGSAVTRTGIAIVIATLPVVLGTAAGMLADAPSVAIGVQTILLAIERSPSLGTEFGALLNLSAIGLLAGVWLIGAGLLVDGLTD